MYLQKIAMKYDKPGLQLFTIFLQRINRAVSAKDCVFLLFFLFVDFKNVCQFAKLGLIICRILDMLTLFFSWFQKCLSVENSGFQLCCKNLHVQIKKLSFVSPSLLPHPASKKLPRYLSNCSAIRTQTFFSLWQRTNLWTVLSNFNFRDSEQGRMYILNATRKFFCKKTDRQFILLTCIYVYRHSVLKGSKQNHYTRKDLLCLLW